LRRRIESCWRDGQTLPTAAALSLRRGPWASILHPGPGKRTTSVLDRLYSLEIEFHRLFRAEAINAVEAAGVPISYALQQGYEPLLRTIGAVDSSELAKARERMMGMSDPRDVQAAFRSLRHLVALA
jgi:hypothetical protein